MDDLRNGSRRGSDVPFSSSSDFYGNNTPELPSAVVSDMPSTATLPNSAVQLEVDHDDGDDSSSEMDVSDASSSSSSSEDSPNHLMANGKKRKFEGQSSSVDKGDSPVLESVKKAKLFVPCPVKGARNPLAADLPPEIWQQVFLHLSPAMLSRCLRVCKIFNSCLTKLKGNSTPSKDHHFTVRVLDAEVLWITSRKNYFPQLPRPLAHFTELQMLQLIGGQTCQFCGRITLRAGPVNIFSAGPGPHGVRPIWPFGTRSCGACLANHTATDIDVLKSPAGSLRQGLSYIFCTPDMHYVPDYARQLPGGMPHRLQIKKMYNKRDLTTIAAEFEDARSLGDGAADEWRKGLATRGKDGMADAARWERWEGGLRPGASLAEMLREYDLSSFPSLMDAQQQSKSAAGSVNATPSVALPTHGMHPLPQPVHVFDRPGFPQSLQAPPSQVSQMQTPQMPRQARNPQEVEEARQARRADIERRCMELEPPLTPSVLQHIDAFRASLQITQPVTDAAWEILKPRILAQREEAELIEHQRAVQLAVLQAAIPSTYPDDLFNRPAKEVYDRDYEQAQEPLRQKLGEYADDRINGHWHRGAGLDRDGCPLFAVDLLEYVRDRYNKDRAAGILPTKEDPSARSRSSKQSSPGSEPFLSLDNMKWVYDNKIRAFTDVLRRELFICAGCAEEKKPKWFAFEGLIQHYGAKHTTDFSRGNVVVHWQTADWPEETPFHLHPAQYIKSERKLVNVKAHRGRHVVPGYNDRGSHTPGSGWNLADHAIFNNGAAQQVSSPGFNGHFQSAPGFPPQNSHAAWSPSLQPQKAEAPDFGASHEAQVIKFSTDSRDIWDQLEGVQDLLACVRMQTLIHHVTSRFLHQFHFKPDLDLVTDALATNDFMRPIKNAHGLACKLCVAAQTDGSASYESYYRRISAVKLFNASSLITHFKIAHQPQLQAQGRMEWDQELIELPEGQLVEDVIRAPGIDDEKLGLIAAAFPDAFPSPLPKVGSVKLAPASPERDSGLASRLLGRITKKAQPPMSKKKKASQVQQTNGDRDSSSDNLPEPREDEYDPRRPMFTQQSKATQQDPSRFDTDIARKSSAQSQAAPKVSIDLASETLAALDSLGAFAGLLPSHDADEGARRSPSVGAANNRVAPQQRPTGPTAAPDIAAILASFTGQMQTPQASVNAMVPHAPSRDEIQRPSSRYVSSATNSSVTLPPVSPAAASAAANVGARHSRPEMPPSDLAWKPGHEARDAHNAYIDATYRAPPSQRSPPRYRYVYEDEAAAPAPAPHHQPPSTYVHQQNLQMQYNPVVTEGGFMAPSPFHRYESLPPQQQQPPAPRTIYVDQYGWPLELIPIIDSAVAPVQYMPHPFAQQAQWQGQRHEQGYGRQASAYAAPMYYEQVSAPGVSYIGADGRPLDGGVRYVPAPPQVENEGRFSVPRGS